MREHVYVACVRACVHACMSVCVCAYVVSVHVSGGSRRGIQSHAHLEQQLLFAISLSLVTDSNVMLSTPQACILILSCWCITKLTLGGQVFTFCNTCHKRAWRQNVQTCM